MKTKQTEKGMQVNSLVQMSGEPNIQTALVPARTKTVFQVQVSPSGVVAASGTAALERGVLVTSRRVQPKAGSDGRRRLLWIGDAVVPTGFATVTHGVLEHLRHEWDVIVSGVNYDGSPHEYPYQILPSCRNQDMWGIDCFKQLCEEVSPEVVVINSDWWIVAAFVRAAAPGTRIIGYMPVDAEGMDPSATNDLNGLAAAVWYTQFGLQEAVKSGFMGIRHVIPHGIDLSLFQPSDQGAARKALSLDVPEGAFIVGNLNRNQPRKRLDLTIAIFAEWLRRHPRADTFLLLHCAEKDTGWDLRRIAQHHGIEERLLLTGSSHIREMQEHSCLPHVYSSLDVQISTTLGEGWGLTTMEGMACGIPQIVPESSALAEWAVPALKIPCSRQLWHPQINTVGALVDQEPFVEALEYLYTHPHERARLSGEGRQLVGQPRYRWQTVAQKFHKLALNSITQLHLNA